MYVLLHGRLLPLVFKYIATKRVGVSEIHTRMQGRVKGKQVKKKNYLR